MSPSMALQRMAIPFHRIFRHAAAERGATESAWVEVRTRGGAIGYGEACPRRYVTGEDLHSVHAFFATHRAALCACISGVGDLIAWEAAHRAEVDDNPAAWCAIELAWLDGLAKERGLSVEALLGLPEVRGTFRYTAVIGVESYADFCAVLERYATAGFADFKVKLCGNLVNDRACLAAFARCAAADWRLRLDANNAWPSATEAAAYLRALDCPFFAIEEPLPARQWPALAALVASTGIRVILDESCVDAVPLAALARMPFVPKPAAMRGDALQPSPPGAWIANVRLSKMGGIVRALRVVDTARQHAIPIIVGAHVGETSLLTRAAFTVASHARDLLVAQEGAFGTRLLAWEVCEPALMFGRGGLLTWPTPAAPGFGLTRRSDLRLPTPLSVS